MGNVVAIVLCIGALAFAVFAVLKLVKAIKEYRHGKADNGKEEDNQ